MFHPDADLFFEKPGSCHPPPSEFGVLYLLRRDIYRCLGVDPVTNTPTSHPTLWPGAMAILAGIDLLAKFYEGSDAFRGAGDRFEGFIEKYFQLDNVGTDKTTIYQLRNSLMHSFGLYSSAKNQDYHFILTANGASLIKMTPPDKYQVDLVTLHNKFEDSVLHYAIELNYNPGLQCKFQRMFPYYGSIRIE